MTRPTLNVPSALVTLIGALSMFVVVGSASRTMPFADATMAVEAGGGALQLLQPAGGPPARAVASAGGGSPPAAPDIAGVTADSSVATAGGTTSPALVTTRPSGST